MLNLNDYFNRLYLKGFISDLRVELGARVLDLGCGACPFKDLYEPRFEMSVTSDIELRQQEVDVLSRVENLPFKNETFDLVLLAEVIEHIADDRSALQEVQRVLVPGGHLILTWPSLYQMHELPSDFWRHTEFGMLQRLTEAGFAVGKIRRRGDLVSVLANILGNVISLSVKALTRIPLLGLVFLPVSWLVDVALSGIYWIMAQFQYRLSHLNPERVGDRLDGFGGRLALSTLGYCIVAQKKRT